VNPENLANLGIGHIAIYPDSRVHGRHPSSKTNLVDAPLTSNSIGCGYNNVGLAYEPELLVLRQLHEILKDARYLARWKVTLNLFRQGQSLRLAQISSAESMTNEVRNVQTVHVDQPQRARTEPR